MPSIILVVILRRDASGANVIVQTTQVNEEQLRLLGNAFAKTSPDAATSDAQSACRLSSSSSDESFSSDSEHASFDSLTDMAHIPLDLDTLDDALFSTGHAPIRSSGVSSQTCSGIAAAAALRTIVALSEVASLAIVHSTTLLEQLADMTSRVGTADLEIHDERLPVLPREDEKQNPQSAWEAAARQIAPSGDEHHSHEHPSASIDDDTLKETLGRCISLRGVQLEVQGRGQTTQGTAECLSARPGSRSRRGASTLYAGLATKTPPREVNEPGMAIFSHCARRSASGANEPDEGDMASIEEEEAQSESEHEVDDAEVVSSLVFDEEVNAIADALRALSLA
ncbi:hypothetical protein PENSPDRAFT_648394 [Peniophora sp. CONT]|nr:hypothetical protein PENSPDRAFT_648394 [Peniophora sp. CONT]